MGKDTIFVRCARRLEENLTKEYLSFFEKDNIIDLDDFDEGRTTESELYSSIFERF